MTAAAEAVAAAAGKPWEDLSDEVLYRPLGMTSTSSRFADFIARPNHAVNHVKVADKWEPRFQRDPDPQSPAGGVSSSVNDMARWLIDVAGQRNLQRPADRLAGSPAARHQPADGVGARDERRRRAPDSTVTASTRRSTSSGRTEYSHSGAFDLGAATNFVVMPSEDVGIIALTNAAPYRHPGDADRRIHGSACSTARFARIGPTLYKKAIGWMNNPEGSLVGKQPPANPAPARPLSDYAGVYASDYWGPAIVTEHDGALQLAMGRKTGRHPRPTGTATPSPSR